MDITNRSPDSNLQPDRYERWKLVVFPLDVPISIDFWRRSFSSFPFVSEAKLRRWAWRSSWRSVLRMKSASSVTFATGAFWSVWSERSWKSLQELFRERT